MASYAVGIDMVEIERVRRVLERHPQRFQERVYTEVEAAVSRGRAQDLAARFAAKEAVMKALGTGARGIAWRDIEILPNRRGKPLVYLHGRAEDRAREIGLKAVDVSLTHSREYAIAAIVGVRNHRGEDLEASREWLVGRLRKRGLL